MIDKSKIELVEEILKAVEYWLKSPIANSDSTPNIQATLEQIEININNALYTSDSQPDYRCNRCGCAPCECDASVTPAISQPQDKSLPKLMCPVCLTDVTLHEDVVRLIRESVCKDIYAELVKIYWSDIGGSYNLESLPQFTHILNQLKSGRSPNLSNC